ncbi:hypothetical protein AAHE18_02G045000 [Arachis hypogaea]
MIKLLYCKHTKKLHNKYFIVSKQTSDWSSSLDQALMSRCLTFTRIWNKQEALICSTDLLVVFPLYKHVSMSPSFLYTFLEVGISNTGRKWRMILKVECSLFCSSNLSFLAF